jgi:hypothetical protein
MATNEIIPSTIFFFLFMKDNEMHNPRRQKLFPKNPRGYSASGLMQLLGVLICGVILFLICLVAGAALRMAVVLSLACIVGSLIFCFVLPVSEDMGVPREKRDKA